jgi:hypothetical protein
MSEQSAAVSSREDVQITLAQIERALGYWRHEALRDPGAGAVPSEMLLKALEELYRCLLADRRRAIAVDGLSHLEMVALHAWRQTLRDEE